MSQSIKELPFSLHQLAGDERLSLFVKVLPEALEQVDSDPEVEIVLETKDYQLIRCDVAKLRELMDTGQLAYINAQYGKGRPLNDQMINNNNVLPVHQGVTPLDTAYTGQGVIMGMIDTGVELMHPDFLWPDGTTRIIELWDHTFEYDEDHIPQPYGFGTRWTKTEIDEGQAIHEDQAAWFGHGSTVTGTACGNGSALGQFTGVAPDADMVIVSFDFNTPTFLEDVAQSVDYIFSVAEEWQRPCVINMSLGTYFGSHDGNDPAALFIDEQLNQSGRLIAAAVGNSQTVTPYHLRVDLQDDSAYTWFEHENNLSVGGPGVFYELWADSSNLSQLQFTFGADRWSPSPAFRGESTALHYTDALGQIVERPIINSEGMELGVAQVWAQYQGAQVQMQILIASPDSSQYRFRLQANGTGLYDIWSTSVFGTSDMVQSDDLPDSITLPEVLFYQAPDDRMHMVSSWACSERVVTVANYMNRTSYVDYTGSITTIEGTQGDIYSSSSAGPARDGLIKPDIAATGSVTLSTGNFPMLEYLIQNEPFKVAPGGMHFRNGGSSMASPVVAGLAALYLQQCPLSDWQDFSEALLSTAAIDTYVGTVPNERWGHGKVNGYGTMVFDAIVPDIVQEGDVLQASGGVSYQWYFDDEPVLGATGDELELLGQGAYQVEVFDENDCSVFSELLLVTDLDSYGTARIRLSPNPAKDDLQLKGVHPSESVKVIDSYGRMVHQARVSDNGSIDVQALHPGVYFIQIERDEEELSLPFIKE